MFSVSKLAKLLFIVGTVFNLVACTPISDGPSKNSASSSSGTWTPLTFSQIRGLTEGYSYRVRNKNSDGSIYYVSPRGRFLVYDPTEDPFTVGFFDGGQSFKFISPDHLVGKKKQAVDALCTKYEITARKIRLCHSFIQKNGVVYLYGDSNFPLEFFKGYGPLVESVVIRADYVKNTAVLRNLKKEFPSYEPAIAAYRRSAAYDTALRTARAEKTAQKAASQRSSDAAATASLGILGWALKSGISVLQEAANTPYTPPPDNTSDTQVSQARASTTASKAPPQIGVVNIVPNGSSASGKPMNKITCGNGKSWRIYRSNGQWYDGIGAQGGNSRSLSEQAEFLCR